MSSTAPSGLSNGLRALFLVVLVAAVAGGVGLWYLFLRPAGPAAVLDPSAAPGASTAAGGGGTLVGGVAGTWTIKSGTDTFVGYRVQEQLANVGGNTAVGRTGAVTGTFTLDGTSVTTGSFTATLTGLKSDDNGRDGRVQDALNTRQNPTTTFVLSSPIALGSVPADGQEITATAKGRLTIRGVTKDVEFKVTAKLSGATLTIKASTDFAFADFSIPKPQSFMVLSIADTGTIEALLTLAKS